MQHRDGIVTCFGCLYGNEVFGRSTVVRENKFVGLEYCSQLVFGARVLGETQVHVCASLVVV